MKKFVKKCLLLLVLACTITMGILLFFFNVISPQYLYGYNASIIDKMELLNSTESPKIILVGNSNVSFGINSEDIVQQFGMDVVNLGLHGGLGNAFHEEMAKQNICEGDIVIIMHSDYARALIAQPDVAWNAIENHVELYSLMSMKDILPMLKALPSYVRAASLKWITGSGNEISENSVYSRCAFNKYGDVSVLREDNEYVFTENSVAVPEISDEDIERINRLNEYCEKRGAYLLIAGYPIADGEFTPDHEKFEDMWKELTERVDCAVISDINDYFYDYEYFYNTSLHLTTDGAEIRTEQLIKDLKEWMLDDYLLDK